MADRSCTADGFAMWANFPFQPVIYAWFIKGCGMYCPVCGKVHIKDPLLLIRKSSLCGDSQFHLKRYVTMTICLMSNSRRYENQWSLWVWLNQTNFPVCVCVCAWTWICTCLSKCMCAWRHACWYEYWYIGQYDCVHIYIYVCVHGYVPECITICVRE